jgi:hypothetical protein
MTVKMYKWKGIVRDKFEHSLTKLDREMTRSGEPSQIFDLTRIKNLCHLSINFGYLICH